MDNNAYLLRCTGTGELLLIDAANDADTLLRLIGDTSRWRRSSPRTGTGITGLRCRRCRRQPGPPPSRIRPTPGSCPSRSPGWSATATRSGSATPVLSVIHLRGHTPGSIALCYEADGELADTPHLFTGDSLFPGGPGNTRQATRPGFNQLITDLEQRVFAELPDGTWVYPGHGKDTTLGVERPHVAEWRARGW